MLYLIKVMGPVGPVLVILAVVIAVLIVKKAVDLFARKNLDEQALVGGLHAILFWGGMSALLGIMGQLQGIYNALNVIRQAKEISPAVVMQGFSESFTTTIFGLWILAVAAPAWFFLAWRYRKIAAARKRG